MNTPEGKGWEHNQIVCPVSAESKFADGYKVMHGLVNNPQYGTDAYGNFAVTYDYLVGKAGLDTDSNWIAYLNRETGKVFVVRFNYEKGKPYPENTSVQIWTQGKGLIFSRNRIVEYKDDKYQNPPYMELELLSPLSEIAPGDEYVFEYQMCACTIPANSGIQTVSRYGVISSPLKVEKVDGGILVTAKFGFFTDGVVKFQIEVVRENGETNRISLHEINASPLEGMDFGTTIIETDGWSDQEVCCTAELFDRNGHFLWEIDKIKIVRYEQL